MNNRRMMNRRAMGPRRPGMRPGQYNNYSGYPQNNNVSYFNDMQDPYNMGYNGTYNYDNAMNMYDEPLYYEDRMFDEAREYERPTYRSSKLLANPDFGNFHFKKGYSAEVWLNDGETIVLSAHSRDKTYRTHYSPEFLRSFFFGWLGRLLRYFYLDRLFGLHIDTVKRVRTKNFILVTAHILPT
ncbi:hypothetical protein AKO1_014335 [Acrasis kona]|uniref:Uncharacterized protein n=1 Tax=Acrasis kona TaxID=1008807 RepID=A0AAW2Z064_9EUKA